MEEEGLRTPGCQPSVAEQMAPETKVEAGIQKAAVELEQQSVEEEPKGWRSLTEPEGRGEGWSTTDQGGARQTRKPSGASGLMGHCREKRAMCHGGAAGLMQRGCQTTAVEEVGEGGWACLCEHPGLTWDQLVSNLVPALRGTGAFSGLDMGTGTFSGLNSGMGETEFTASGDSKGGKLVNKSIQFSSGLYSPKFLFSLPSARVQEAELLFIISLFTAFLPRGGNCNRLSQLV